MYETIYFLLGSLVAPGKPQTDKQTHNRDKKHVLHPRSQSHSRRVGKHARASPRSATPPLEQDTRTTKFSHKTLHPFVDRKSQSIAAAAGHAASACLPARPVDFCHPHHRRRRPHKRVACGPPGDRRTDPTRAKKTGAPYGPMGVPWRKRMLMIL